MGLDMHVYKTKDKIAPIGTTRPSDTVVPDDICVKTTKTGKTTFDFDKYNDLKSKFEVAYWRKHANLHGWFKQLWNARGGKPSSKYFGDNFNGGDWVRIDAADLDALENAITHKKLPHTTGFFFGASYGDEDEITYDLKFIADARQALADGYNLFYTSSW